MGHYTLQVSSHATQEFVGYPGARSLRSALGSLNAWTLSLGPSGSAYCAQNLLFGPDDVASTDNLLVRMTLGGMSRRLGTESRPPTAIRAEHVWWNLRHRHNLIAHPLTSAALKHDLRLANLAELVFWLGWLRASEAFALRWGNIDHFLPALSASRGLPPSVGALFLKLLESTKSHQTTQVDMILAALTASGFDLGAAFSVAQDQRPAGSQPTDRIFQSARGKLWDSRFFCHTHVYPLLEQQRLEGDPSLLPYDGVTPTRTIPLLFYSMGSYRCGTNSHVRRCRLLCVRRATPEEIGNHGRWRSRNRGREPMPVHYDEPSSEDLLYITLLCM
jgi:hypothetical protein